MRIIRYPLPDLSKEQITEITEKNIIGTPAVKVENTSGFSVGDYVVIEDVGNEISEMSKVDTISSETEFEILPAFSREHSIGTSIRKTLFNQARLHKSTDGETYTLQDTQDLNWQDRYGIISFVDDSGLPTDYYKVEYYNSDNPNLSIFSDPLRAIQEIGYLTIEEFKNETGLDGNDIQISKALRYGAEEISRIFYIEKVSKTNKQDTDFILDVEKKSDTLKLEFADGNLDGEISANDFVAYEADHEGVRTYVTSDISAVDVDRYRISFANPHPETGKTLVFEYKLATWKLKEYYEIIKRINLLYAVNYLYKNLMINRFKKGSGSWSLNGVSFDFKSGEINDLIKNNNLEAFNLVERLRKSWMRKTEFKKPFRRLYGYSSVSPSYF